MAMPSHVIKLVSLLLCLRTVLAVAVDFSLKISFGPVDTAGAVVIT